MMMVTVMMVHGGDDGDDGYGGDGDGGDDGDCGEDESASTIHFFSSQ